MSATACVDRAADYRSIPLERGATLSDPRSRRGLRSRCQAPITGHGHPRQADFGGIAVAELLCRTTSHPSRAVSADII